eukprot:GHRR01023037.1.p1 GENE.GHRR01023037.1~~GHRR01023037.1.p1  ORF type:complete len:204 (+),score=68.19 GHRR01023037.1:569-1180(+)
MPTTWCRVPRELLLTSCNFVNMNVLKKLTGYRQSLDKPELRPKAVLLDVNGTLFPATAAAPAFREIGLDEGLIELWFTKVLRDAFAAQAAGLYRPFKDIGAYHLDVLLRKAGKDSRLTGVEAMSKLVQAWSSAALYPDIPEALRTLNNANIKVRCPQQPQLALQSQLANCLLVSRRYCQHLYPVRELAGSHSNTGTHVQALAA